MITGRPCWKLPLILLHMTIERTSWFTLIALAMAMAMDTGMRISLFVWTIKQRERSKINGNCN
ncbi:hypothetical protein NC652_025499 [Populus alba x Populus x berolinensis]|nr:hypothetical protein NC652_025499 [Populus alba x Populus x berolinensis]